MRVWSLKPSLVAAAAAIGCVIASGLAVVARAEPPSPAAAASPDAVVARVGDQVLTVREVERRIAQVPLLQLSSFGQTPEEIRKNFVETVLVRELLLAQGAGAQHLAERGDVRDRLRAVLRNAMVQQLQAEAAKSSPITDDDVRAYYEANRDRFSSPPRIALWRIVVATREEAVAILADLKKDLTPKHWSDVAREKSLDKTTSLRGGNLGFVSPDGATADPAVKVDKRLVEAAARVKDAELVDEPVPDGDRFAIVWRRQSMKAVNRALEQEASSIRQILAHTRTEARLKEVLGDLRARDVSGYAPDLVDLIDVTSTGDLQPLKRPGTLPSSRRPGAPPPSPVPRHGDLR